MRIKPFSGLVGKLREAVGDEIDLMVEFHGRTTTGQANPLVTRKPQKKRVIITL